MKILGTSTGAKIGVRELPPGLTRLSYMRWAGPSNQRVLYVTNFAPNVASGFHVEFRLRADVPNSAAVTSTHYLGGIGSTTQDNRMIPLAWRLSSGDPIFQFFNAETIAPNAPSLAEISADPNRWRTTTMNWTGDGKLTLDGVDLRNLSAPTQTPSGAMCGIGTGNLPSSIFSTSYWRGDIRRWKISSVGAVVRDYVPCVDAGGVPLWACLLTGHRALRHPQSVDPAAVPGPPAWASPMIVGTAYE